MTNEQMDEIYQGEWADFCGGNGPKMVLKVMQDIVHRQTEALHKINLDPTLESEKKFLSAKNRLDGAIGLYAAFQARLNIKQKEK